jgi:hypothetical protein
MEKNSDPGWKKIGSGSATLVIWVQLTSCPTIYPALLCKKVYKKFSVSNPSEFASRFGEKSAIS